MLRKHLYFALAALVVCSSLWRIHAQSPISVEAQNTTITFTNSDGAVFTPDAAFTDAVLSGQIEDMNLKLREASVAMQNGGVQNRMRTGTSRISGRVLSTNGTPLRLASVRVSASELNGVKTATTDQDGRYEVRDLPAGRYSVNASKANYLSLSNGQLRPGDSVQTIDLADNQPRDSVDIRLPRGGVIAGRILDEYGEPVAEAQVVAMQRRLVQNEWRLTASGRFTTTNDIGEFRLFGLGPGKYYISSELRTNHPPDLANASESGRFGYAPTYFPGTSSQSSAQPIAVGLSETVSGVDMSLTATRLATVSGSVISQQSNMMRGSIQAFSVSGGGTSSFSSPIRPDGSFQIPGLPPGDYILRGSLPPPPPPPPVSGTPVVQPKPGLPMDVLTARVSVNGGDVSGVVLSQVPRISIVGRVTLDGNAANVQRNMLRVMMTPATYESSMIGMGPTNQSQVAQDGSFVLTSPALEMRIQAALPGWTLKSVRVGGVDITDTGVDLRGGRDVNDVQIELTDHPPQVTGMVTDGRGQPQTAMIILFPQERERWIPGSRMLATARADASGRYRATSLPPGRYLAVVADSGQPVPSLDPDLLETLRIRAVPFVLTDGQTTALDLKVNR